MDVNPRSNGARIGLVLPSINSLCEPEFYWAVAAGLSFHTARVHMAQTTRDDLIAMNAEVEGACRLLRSATPDVVAYACTSGTFIAGRAGLDALVAEMAAIVRCPVVATSRAMLDALAAVGARSVALVTPYPDDITESEAAFLADNGYNITFARGLGRSGKAVRGSPPKEVEALVAAAAATGADAIFVSCTDLQSFEQVPQWEQRFGIPVLTSNQVTLWAACQILRASQNTARPPIALMDWVTAQALFRLQR